MSVRVWRAEHQIGVPLFKQIYKFWIKWSKCNGPQDLAITEFLLVLCFTIHVIVMNKAYIQLLDNINVPHLFILTLLFFIM